MADGLAQDEHSRAIAGLRPFKRDRFFWGDREVCKLRQPARGIGYVPQDGALFPTMTVREHLAFALMASPCPAAEIERRVVELADWLDIAPLLIAIPPA